MRVIDPDWLFWIAMGGARDMACRNGLEVNKIFDKYGIKYDTNTTMPGIPLSPAGIICWSLRHCVSGDSIAPAGSLLKPNK